MSTKVSQPRPFESLAGVKPSTDATALSTEHYTHSDKIRFDEDGKPRKIGGWESFSWARSNAISGLARSIFSMVFSNRVQTIVGTHTRLYNISGSTLTNITPLVTGTTAAANSLATVYDTLANNPLTTTNGSQDVIVADTNASRFRAGDTVTLSGASTTNGVPNTDINKTHIIRSIGTNEYTITVATAASSGGVGGGASVVRATGLMRLNKTSHGLLDGDRVKIASAADTGGIVATTYINKEHIIRRIDADNFDFFTGGTSTSSVSGSGGASTTIQGQISAGESDELAGSGYGAGLYGVGLYGTALSSTSGRNFVRTWFNDRFGDTFITTAGNQTGVYSWGGDVSAAPTLITNAPTAINYAFVSNNILVTFGASGVENRIKTSDINALTQWTGSSTNQVFEDDIEGAGRLISHVNVSNVNLIFTEQQCYTFRYIGLPNIWEIKVKDPAIGLIAPMARVVINGIAYWMGRDNFYMWRGGNIEIIPANSQKQSTLLRYVFDNINISQKSKFFAWHNEKYNEAWFHYCSEGSNEPDRVARVNLSNFAWSPDTIDRTAAEYPNINQNNPKLIDSAGTLYRHEYGFNADGAAMSWELTSNFKTFGKNNAFLVGIIPDSIQEGDINLNVQARRWPQSSSLTYDADFAVSATSERIPISVSGRFWQYTLSGSSVNQDFKLGQWLEELQEGAAN